MLQDLLELAALRRFVHRLGEDLPPATRLRVRGMNSLREGFWSVSVLLLVVGGCWFCIQDGRSDKARRLAKEQAAAEEQCFWLVQGPGDDILVDRPTTDPCVAVKWVYEHQVGGGAFPDLAEATQRAGRRLCGHVVPICEQPVAGRTWKLPPPQVVH